MPPINGPTGDIRVLIGAPYGFILAWPLMVYNVFTDTPSSGGS
jgi:hypothetical protein